VIKVTYHRTTLLLDVTNPLFQITTLREHQMGNVAYYIEFDNENLEIDHTDGKSVARAMDELNALAEEIGVTPLEQFMGQSMEDISDMLGEDIEMEDGSDGTATWFEPSAGITALERLITELKANPRRIPSATDVAEDLESYCAALRTAQAQGAKWHLAIDF
jgi:hypothetical protein